MAGLAQDFADLGRADLTERVEKDTRLPAMPAFCDAFALKIMFAWARRSSTLNRDLDTPSTLAVFRAVANGALIRVVIKHILYRRFVDFHRTVMRSRRVVECLPPGIGSEAASKTLLIRPGH
jgi:hypothetical protein